VRHLHSFFLPSFALQLTPYEQANALDLVRTENKVFNKTVIVFVALCNEIEGLKKEVRALRDTTHTHTHTHTHVRRYAVTLVGRPFLWSCDPCGSKRICKRKRKRKPNASANASETKRKRKPNANANASTNL
jgi:hypothetical protein